MHIIVVNQSVMFEYFPFGHVPDILFLYKRYTDKL